MSLKLNSSGGGSVTLQEPATASNVILTLPSADGTVLTTTSAPGPQAQVFTASGTFTPPTGVTAVKVTVVGGGGGGGSPTGNSSSGGGGAGGGVAIEWVTGLTGAVTVTVGTGGGSGAAGLTSSFGAFCSATGGAAGASPATTNTSGAGGNGGVGSGGNLNLSGGVGSTSNGSSRGGPGGGAGGEITDKLWFLDLTNCSPTNIFINPNGQVGYLGGKGGNVTAPAVGVNAAGNAASGFGNGGSGSVRFNATLAGGAGTAGIVIVEY